LAMAGKSCCGHTCEGTCTKSADDGGSDRESKR
jgi:hypothetical protein